VRRRPFVGCNLPAGVASASRKEHGDFMKFLLKILGWRNLAFATAVLNALPLAHASTPEEWQKLDEASAKACIAASGFRDAKAEPSLHFSDELAVDARVVSGIYPQQFMNGATGRMLCLYSRKTERAEVQEILP
jgi:hypothetical protein